MAYNNTKNKINKNFKFFKNRKRKFIVLLALSVLFSLSFSLSSNVLAEEGLIFYDPLDSIETVQNNGGTTVGVSFIEGIKDMAALINGHIDYPYENNFNPDEGTVQFLVKPTDAGSMGLFESGKLGYANSLGIFRFDQSGRKISVLEIRKNNDSYLQAWHDKNEVRFESDGTWYLITGIWKCNQGGSNNDFFQLYINDVSGVRRIGGVCTEFLESLTRHIRLGSTSWYGDGEGEYDELKIYNFAKTEPQIKEDYKDYFSGGVACYRNSDCGTDGWFEAPICQDDNVYQDYITYTCHNVGTIDAFCSNQTELTLKQICKYGCTNGQCNVFEKPESTGSVKIVGNKLFVDGKEFIVKSIGYNPVPIGESPGNGYDITVHSELRDRDFPLLRQMNANTIRVWGRVNSRAFLDDAWNNNNQPIRMIMGFWMGSERNYKDEATRQAILTDFKAYVDEYKDHPVVLMWAIGNEENYFYTQGDNEKHAAYFSLVNEMAEVAYNIEGDLYHPVMAIALEMPEQMDTVGNQLGGADDASIPFVDIWGINHYPGKNLETFFNNFKAYSSKPLLITEYGVDALDNRTRTEYQEMQAEWDIALWRDIEASDVAIGGSLMAYSDEWWKDWNGSVSNHDFGGYSTLSHPDGYANEEWWGIMRTVDNGTNPDIMEPRGVYYSLKEEWRDLYGDVNQDCKVNILDLVMVRNYLGKNPTSSSEAGRCDVNSDGKINILDLVFVRNHLGTSCQ